MLQRNTKQIEGIFHSGIFTRSSYLSSFLDISYNNQLNTETALHLVNNSVLLANNIMDLILT